jgi:hypothetical protein
VDTVALVTSSWRYLPEPARAVATTVTDAVAAACERDPDGYREVAARLAALNSEQVAVVVGAVVRSLLEELHPDGLDGDDLRAVLERCVRSTLDWLPSVDVDVLVVLLTGALGVHQSEAEARVLAPLDVALHAPLLLADLLSVAGRPLAGYLTAALAEVARAETVEMP